MTVSSKIRIYDLAKELKLDTKRLIEEVRREGVDVSVPSNSVSKELAEKIRNKYFPKKEAAVKRTVKVVQLKRHLPLRLKSRLKPSNLCRLKSQSLQRQLNHPRPHPAPRSRVRQQS